MAQADIADSTWTLIRRVNAFGARGIDAHVTMLWRHLAYWPGLLAVVHDALAPLAASGGIAAASGRVMALAAEEGASMAHLRAEAPGIPAAARETIVGYVGTTTQVVRMVTLGHVLARWLR